MFSTYPQPELRIKWAECPNPEYADIHTTLDIPQFSRYKSEREKQTPEATAIHDAILAIPGVTECNSYWRYRVSVQKGEMFTFDEIMPKVEAVLREYFAAQAKAVDSVN